MFDEGDTRIEVEPDLEGRVVILVHGSLDLPEVGQLRGVFDQLCTYGGAHVVLDLTEVPFMGSSGMGAIAGFRGQLAAERRTLLVRGASPAIRKAFQITRLDQRIPFEPQIDLRDGEAQSANASGGGQAHTRLRSP